MKDVVIKVTPQGVGYYHATACVHTFATAPDMAARLAAARALGCTVDEVTLSTPTPRGVFVATHCAAPERKAS